MSVSQTAVIKEELRYKLLIEVERLTEGLHVTNGELVVQQTQLLVHHFCEERNRQVTVLRADVEISELWVGGLFHNRCWVGVVLDNGVIIDSFNDVVGYCLHGILLLDCILIKRQFKRLLVKLVFLLEVFSSQLELVVLLLSHQVLDVVRKLLLREICPFSIFLLVLFNLRHDAFDVVFFDHFSNHFHNSCL